MRFRGDDDRQCFLANVVFNAWRISTLRLSIYIAQRAAFLVVTECEYKRVSPIVIPYQLLYLFLAKLLFSECYNNKGSPDPPYLP